jgi:hypothetical protein
MTRGTAEMAGDALVYLTHADGVTTFETAAERRNPMKTPTKPQAKPFKSAVDWPDPAASNPYPTTKSFLEAPLADPDVRRLAVALRDGLKDVAFGPDLARARETVAASIFAAKG